MEFQYFLILIDFEAIDLCPVNEIEIRLWLSNWKDFYPHGGANQIGVTGASNRQTEEKKGEEEER